VTAALDDRGMSAIPYWPLLGIAVVIIGFAIRVHPVLVVMVAAIVTGVAARLSPVALVGDRLPRAAVGAAVLALSGLAALGGVRAGKHAPADEVGEARRLGHRLLAALVKANVPVDSRAVAVIAYGTGMAGLTMIMGNAFAAFPVMTAGVGLPLLVQLHGANPAALGAIGMLTGYCGTLMTPMAANFNIVPVALLGPPTRRGAAASKFLARS
jgi:uncharacterized membrane protein